MLQWRTLRVPTCRDGRHGDTIDSILDTKAKPKDADGSRDVSLQHGAAQRALGKTPIRGCAVVGRSSHVYQGWPHPNRKVVSPIRFRPTSRTPNVERTAVRLSRDSDRSLRPTVAARSTPMFDRGHTAISTPRTTPGSVEHRNGQRRIHLARRQQWYVRTAGRPGGNSRP